jgi:hypothetical protein
MRKQQDTAQMRRELGKMRTGWEGSATFGEGGRDELIKRNVPAAVW